jgi:hypothetical protein
MVARLYTQALGSSFVASYYSQGYDGGIQLRLHTGLPELNLHLHILASIVLLITPLDGPSRQQHFQQYLCCYMRTHCRGSVFTSTRYNMKYFYSLKWNEKLPSKCICFISSKLMKYLDGDITFYFDMWIIPVKWTLLNYVYAFFTGRAYNECIKSLQLLQRD